MKNKVNFILVVLGCFVLGGAIAIGMKMIWVDPFSKKEPTYEIRSTGEDQLALIFIGCSSCPFASNEKIPGLVSEWALFVLMNKLIKLIFDFELITYYLGKSIKKDKDMGKRFILAFSILLLASFGECK
ncbi:MAG: hypothetical protein FH748_05455 [Balneolaceae bacterium]|nr:hypothetical protein [Balneolaceae bacterium]